MMMMMMMMMVRKTIENLQYVDNVISDEDEYEAGGQKPKKANAQKIWKTLGVGEGVCYMRVVCVCAHQYMQYPNVAEQCVFNNSVIEKGGVTPCMCVRSFFFLFSFFFFKYLNRGSGT